MTRSNKKQSIRIPSAGGKQGRGGDQGIKKGGAGAHNWGRDGDEYDDVVSGVWAVHSPTSPSSPGYQHVKAVTHVDFYGIGF
ncbi:hypothetical protein HDU79_003240 [Rhizoclosmatium sp. JEL0117]|nr:hypothetical protein HDU79_003240 [Rhizoclosmatium sp. JEL0117]